MRLTVVGCSGSYPGPDSPASCYLLEADGPGSDGVTRTWRILLDLGNGALGALHRYVDPLTIDGVLLSHLHADHCLDLCGYYVMRKYHPTGAQPPIPVYGPEGTADRLARAYDLPPDPGMHEEFDFIEYSRSFTLGPFTVSPIAVAHPVAAFALRITVGDRVLTYSGDSGACDALEFAAQTADLFLCEASFEEGRANPEDLHLTGREAAEIAKQAQVRRLVLTHIPPWHDAQVVLEEALTAFGSDVELARPGATYEI